MTDPRDVLTPLTARVPKHVHEDFAKYAAARGRSMTMQVRVLLETLIEKDRMQNPENYQ